MQKITYVLLVMIAITMTFALSGLKDASTSASSRGQQDVKAQRYEQAKGHFPTADYNEPNPLNSEEDRVRKEKQKRFNDLMKWVSANPQAYVTENVAIPEGLFNFPALPVATSDVILVGVVGSTKAHLSENKRNVFSEFSVAVEKIIKTDQAVKEGSAITIDRMGGFVRYPNGQKVLYRISGAYMPKIGTRYLFFLDSVNKQDYVILTAYELSETGVIPLDLSSQFESLEGKSEAEVLQKLRAELQQTSN